MRRAIMRASASLVAAAVVLSLPLAAQTPNFAGDWLLNWPLTDAANAKLGGPGEPHGATTHLSITQSAKELTIRIDSHPVRHFKLDGSESVNVLEGGKTMVSRATLQAGQLKIVNSMKGASGTGTLLYSVAADTLTEMITSPNHDGPGTITTALVYKRMTSSH
jgi:hypothetical protein